MGKAGEINYLKSIGPVNTRGATLKPFSEPDCWRNLMEIGAVMALLPPRPARLLDLGCGTGWTSRFFARAGFEVVGIDICPDMILHAEEIRRREGLDRLSFLVADYEELRFRDEFDAAIFYDSLHHAVDEEMALGKAYEGLRRGGMCVTSEPGEGHSLAPASVRAMREHGVTEKDMAPRHIMAIGRRLGFSEFSCFPFSWVNQVFDIRKTSADSPNYRGGGPLKRLVHWLIRTVLRMSKREYGALMGVRDRIADLTGADRLGGITRMVK